MLSRSASSPLLRSSSIQKHSPSPTLRSCVPLKKTSRTSSELNLNDLDGKPKSKLFSNGTTHQNVIEKQECNFPGLNLSIGSVSCETEYSVLIDGGSFGGINGGRFCGGGGGGGGGGGDEQHGFNQSTDQYYQELIKVDPTNSLVLGNYAKFLKEVKGDNEKAEEYLGRAILAKANDGQVFSMYGGLMWDVHKDTDRAKYYFKRAVEAAPDDCYVRASYARFLWDAEEDEDVEGGCHEEVLQGNLIDSSCPSAEFLNTPWSHTNSSCFMT